MKRVLSLVLLIALVTGCGYVPATPELKRVTEVQTVQTESIGLAQTFASCLKLLKAKIKVIGAKVSVQHGANSPVVYDFADSPKTHQVRISYDDYETTIPVSKLTQSRGIPVIAVHIAIELALGAAKGAAIYYLTHKDNFVKDEMYKSIVQGMIFAMLDYTTIFPFSHAKELLLLVMAIVRNSKSLHFKDLADSALSMVDMLVEFISNFHVYPGPLPV